MTNCANEPRRVIFDHRGISLPTLTKAAALPDLPPVLDIRQLGTDKVELTLQVSDHIWEDTGGKDAYKRHLLEAVEKLRQLAKEFPGVRLPTQKEMRHDGQMTIDSLSKRLRLKVWLKSNSDAERYKKILGGEWSSTKEITKDNVPYYIIESCPSEINYINAHPPLAKGPTTRLEQKTAELMLGLELVSQAVQTISEGKASVKKHYTFQKRDGAIPLEKPKPHLQISLPAKHSATSADTIELAKKLWKGLERTFHIKIKPEFVTLPSNEQNPDMALLIPSPEAYLKNVVLSSQQRKSGGIINFEEASTHAARIKADELAPVGMAI